MTTYIVIGEVIFQIVCPWKGNWKKRAAK